MEVFDVKYEGKNVWVRKVKDGEMYIKLPTRYGDRNSEFYETISKDSRGWRFTSQIIDDPDYIFHLWLQNDGRIAWTNDMQPRIQVSNEKFNPDIPNAGVLNDTAVKLYDVVKQIEEHEKVQLPVSVDDVIEARRHNLAAALHLLGFDSVEDVIQGKVNDSAGYLPLNRLSEQLRQSEYSLLPMYVHSIGRAGSHDLVRYRIPEGKTIEDLKRVYEVVDATKTANMEYIAEQDEWIDKKRGISFEYNALLSARLGNEGADWETYSKALKYTGALFLALNIDLLSKEQREKLKLPDVTKLTPIEFEDMISAVIDSKVFNDACKIENEFAFEEASRLARRAEGQLEGVTSEIENTNPVKDMRAILAHEKTEIERRKKYIESEKKLRTSVAKPKNDAKAKGKEDDDDQYGY